LSAILEPIAAPTDPAARPETASGRRLVWWRELILVAAFYAGYSFIRGQFGSGADHLAEASANAQRVVDVETRLGIFNEHSLQRLVLHWPAIIRALNIFYGMFHFAVPVFVLAVLFVKAPARYRRSRDILAATTGLALVGFSLFPLLPPRLLCTCPLGAPLGSGADGGFVDTLARYGGFWTFGSHGVGAVANQYAAMPSLHFAWSLWCAVALYPFVRRRWARILVVAYPALTLVAIIVTANHFWLDAVGGAVVFGVGYGLVRLVHVARIPRWSEDSVQVLAPLQTEAVP